MKTMLMASAAALSLAGAPVEAASITSAGDSLLTGSTTITFSEVALGSTNPTIAGVSFSAASGQALVQNNVVVPSSPFLGNQTIYSSGTTIFVNFATGVSAFGTGLFSVNSDTIIEAYDSSNLLLGSVLLASSGSLEIAVDGFRGLGGFDRSIASARIVTTDFLGIDNFQFVSAPSGVPEPATWAMMTLGFGAMGFAMRRKKAATRIRFA